LAAAVGCGQAAQQLTVDLVTQPEQHLDVAGQRRGG